MIKSILQCTVVFAFAMSFSVNSVAHTYLANDEIKKSGTIKIMPVKRSLSEKLPRTLYAQTMGHTYQRKFVVNNQVVRDVYVHNRQSDKMAYGSLIVARSKQKLASSYWP